MTGSVDLSARDPRGADDAETVLPLQASQVCGLAAPWEPATTEELPVSTCALDEGALTAPRTDPYLGRSGTRGVHDDVGVLEQFHHERRLQPGDGKDRDGLSCPGQGYVEQATLLGVGVPVVA